MSNISDQQDVVAPLGSFARFQITKIQYLFATISVAAVVALGASSTLQSTAAINQAQILSAIETPAASIIFTQRETLVYVARLAQWANGGTPRRSVQITRNVLAQRLAVIDTSGRSMGERAPVGYLRALSEADTIVASGPMGTLPSSLQGSVNARISPVIDQIFAESRKFVASYQKSIDQTLSDGMRNSADRNRLNLTFCYVFLIFGLAFLLLNVRLNFRNYRIARSAIEHEQIRLDRTIEELNKAQSTVVELQDLDQAKNAFISTVNHELRTPLTSIIGYIDIIREKKVDKKDEEMVGFLEILERNAEILLDLVDSILSLSKSDLDQSELPQVKVALNNTIDNVLSFMKPAIAKKRLTTSFSVDSEYFVYGVAGQLSQVMINLLANAIKFSPEGASIEIWLGEIVNSSDQRCVQVGIKDHGIGIPPEDVEHLFTRFFRAKNAVSQQYPGTGLGLVIVQQIVAKHGGQIHLSSVMNEGTVFTIELPIFISDEKKMITQWPGDPS